MQQDKPTITSKGLHLDNSLVMQPKDTYRFALNSLNESELGDLSFIGNENSNSPFSVIKSDFILLGKVYMGEGTTCLFSVSKDDKYSEIGILNDNGTYTVHVNDTDSLPENRLNFKVAKQIQAIYRLRRGCEKTIYFTDNFNRPRYFNFNKTEEFQDTTGWVARKFSLVREYSKIPEFTSIQVLNSGGELFPGSYNVAIQYVDSGLNPTEWITTSEILYVYNDSTTQNYLDIQGSIHSLEEAENFPITSKSIRVDVDNLDTDFPFYRLAFIEANTGSGIVNDVKITNVIPTTKTYYVYSGTNIVDRGTTEEIAFFNSVIHTAGSIEQLENRLLLANTKGPQVQLCKLQKYASRIKTDVVLKKVLLNDINDLNNPKNPAHRTHNVGYMPGEIYSFGIVYVFEDGSVSPTYHIPGKSTSVSNLLTYTEDSYPMSNKNNSSQGDTYTDLGTCANSDYWGLDCEGKPLKDKPVRHHRFPKRSELGLDLVTVENSVNNPFSYYRLAVHIDSPLTGATEPFPVNVEYTVDGEPQEFTFVVDPANYTPPAIDTFLSTYHTSDDIIITAIKELQPSGATIDLVANPGTSEMGSVYTADLIPNLSTIQSNIYSTEILGVQFSGIDLPDELDTVGNTCIGYYIVRSERTDSEKTIIDSGVIIPNVVNSKYSAHGLLNPDVDAGKIDKRVYGLITPEHKFHDKQFTDFDSIEQEGYFSTESKVYSKTRYNDVLDGTSFDSETQKDGNDDGSKSNGGKGADGWSLATILRDTFTKFNREKYFDIPKDKIKEIFYLKALESREITDGSTAKTVYNIAADNRVGFVHLTEDNMINVAKDKLPYVLLKRDLVDYYSNFRTLPYYKDSANMSTGNTTTVFNGDSYVSPMRYTNTMFWDNRVARRAGATSAWKYIAGGALALLGTALLVFGGAGALIIGAGIAIIGGGSLLVASGVSKDSYNKAYTEEWAKGLRETALDAWTDRYYKQNESYFGTPPNTPIGPVGTEDGPSDDEIEWITDCVTDFWFETQVNTALRTKMIGDAPTFLDAPGKRETGNAEPLIGWEYFGIHYESAVSRYPISVLDNYSNRKLLVFDTERKDNRSYLGVPLGVHYKLNPDYLRLNRQKVFFHLPLEYDCCSDCIEEFPHRIHYSEQSFQEELVDNYRVFLPNNYRDIDGETGPITNVFKINNSLFLHTNEALWNMPKNYQERVTDQIVSFIGTGSYFEVPPQKILDDDTGSSAGLQHKWGTIKTPQGYMFVSENQRKVYLFNGANLKVLSDLGLSNYFKEHTKLTVNSQYNESLGVRFKYDDNPSNPLGTGFITAYDTKKERLLITKKDYSLNPTITGSSDFDIDVNTGELTYFPNISETIADQSSQGYNYIGIENSQLKFEKLITTTVTETRYDTISIFKDVDFLEFFYVMPSGITDLDTDSQLLVPTVTNRFGFALLNTPSDYMMWSGDNTGFGLESVVINIKKLKEDFPEAAHIQFQARAYWHTNSNIWFDEDPGPGIDINTDSPGAYINIRARAYVGGDVTGGESEGMYGPFVFTGEQVGEDYNFPDVFITTPEISSAGPVEAPTSQNVGLYTYTISTGDLSVSGISGGSNPPEVIKQPITVEVDQVSTDYRYIDGVVVYNPVEANTSWTMSFSLKANAWISWHSYLPNMYINTPENLYSWVPDRGNIWKHHVKGSYQTFYGTYYPHILEYVSVANPLVTQITNSIRLQTEAKRFDENTLEYVEDRDTTFNNAVVYNSRQCTGLLRLKVKDANLQSEDYLSQQIVNLNDNSIIIDRNERDWYINDIRDIRVDYTKPIWNANTIDIQSEYPIDKIINASTMDVDKDWTQLESFRDKFLVVRLIFDNFANTKLITNFTIENEQQSFT